MTCIFNYSNKFTKAKKQLSEQGREALFALRCYIGGVVNYAPEIWETQTGQNIKNLHLDLYKQLLGIKITTSSSAEKKRRNQVTERESLIIEHIIDII